MPSELIAPTPETAERWRLTRLRLRLLDGRWTEDAKRHQARHLDPAKSDAWGEPTTALNLFKSVVNQLAVFYLEQPSIRIDPPDESAEAWLSDEAVFRIHQHMSKIAIGAGECAIRVGWTPGHHAAEAGLSLEVVSPHLIYARDDARAPGEPVEVWHAIQRNDPSNDNRPRWFYDVYDISREGQPIFRILRADERSDKPGMPWSGFEDVTPMFLKDSTYRWIYEGVPFIPYALYHNKEHGGLWCPTVWHELVEGTLDTSLLASHAMHGVKNASWEQKFGKDVELQGTRARGEGSSQRSEVSTDQSSILLFKSTSNSPGELGTFPAASIPTEMMTALKAWIAMVASNSGINPSELEKADRESGVAIQLRSDAVRKRMKSYTDVFARTDAQFLSLVAKTANLFAGEAAPPLPVEGYSVAYPSLPMTREEIEQLLKVRQAEMDLGLVSRVDLLMERNPSLSRERAIARLREIDDERRQFPAASTVSVGA